MQDSRNIRQVRCEFTWHTVYFDKHFSKRVITALYRVLLLRFAMEI